VSAIPVQLSVQLLERFRAALRAAGAPLGDAIGPGLSDAQIDELAVELGAAVPPELRTLWSWGYPASTWTDGGWDINPSFELWPPSHAVLATRHYQQSFEPLAAHIAFAGPPQTDYLIVPGNESTPTSPVLIVSLEDPGKTHAAPSLGALFQLWTEQLARGDFRFVGDEWQPPYGPLPFIRD
jgi:hypothetical protein